MTRIRSSRSTRASSWVIQNVVRPLVRESKSAVSPSAVAGENPAVATQTRIVALRQSLDEVVRVRPPRGVSNCFIGPMRCAERDALAHGEAGQDAVLKDDAELRAER